MTRLCLVRHGQTDWNLEGRYQGQSDIPLNSTGIKQARLIAEILRDEKFDAVYSSDLSRAIRTAEIITEHRNHLKINTDPRLREVRQGEWEGLTRDIIRDRYPKIWEALIENPVSAHPPGGETVLEVQSRVNAALNDISALYPDGNILVVSHGLALATVICSVNGFPIGLAYQKVPENADPIWVPW